MKRSLRARWLLAPLFVVGLILVSDKIVAENDVKDIFEKRCSLCHPVSKPLGQSKSGEEWRKTVTKMKGYAGGRISNEEAETITKYLTEIRGK